MGKGAARLRHVWGLGTTYVASKLVSGAAVVGSPAFVVAVVSLAFSGITLYVTLLEEPRLTIYAGCNWQYGRGPGSFDEYFVVPVTVVNSGARGGTVLAIELLVDKGGTAGSFAGNFTVAGLNEEARRLFAPIAVAGHAAASSAVVFTRQTRTTTDPLLFDPARYAAPERFQATLKLRTAVSVSYGFVDRLFANPSTDARFEVQPGDLEPVRIDKPASLDACAPAPPDSATAKSK
jgi:hypothetical protein